MKFPTRAAALALVALQAGCADSPSSPPVEETPRVHAIVTSTDTLRLTALGDTATVSAIPVNAQGSAQTAALSWTSADESIATVSPQGLVTGRARGRTTVTVRADTARRVIVIDVTQVPTTVSVATSPPVVTVGDSVRLGASARDRNANVINGARLAWTTSHPNVASVDTSGLVRALAVGTATITVAAVGGTGSASVDVKVERRVNSAGWIAITAGEEFTCGISAQRRAYCWGDNFDGTLGNNSMIDDSPLPVEVSGNRTYRAIDAGEDFVCALGDDARIWCWGANDSRQLGNGTTTALSRVPVAVSGSHTFTALGVGAAHACGITATGELWCWGANAAGQLGSGNTQSAGTPVQVSGGLRFALVDAGTIHTCGIVVTGGTYCWGSGFGVLGSGGTSLGSAIPVGVSGGAAFRYVSSGGTHSCAITSTDRLHCWGNNDEGQLGVATGACTEHGVPCSSTPLEVAPALRFGTVAAGGLLDLSYTCALTTDGAAYCWGSGPGLGNGTANDSSVPSAVIGGLRFSSVATGVGQTCAIDVEDMAWCWGRGGTGQLGTGEYTGSLTPVRVAPRE